MMRPRFEYGQAVRVTRDLRNDGTYPGVGTGKLLAPRGSVGHIRDVGVFLQDQIIYSVHFLAIDRVVGCRESELIAANGLRRSACFKLGERVSTRISLAVSGAIVAGPGAVGEIQDIVQTAEGHVFYQLAFGNRFFHVPESALQALRYSFVVDPATK